MSDRNEIHEAEVIDLAAISRPARRVVDIYDQVQQGRRPPPGLLDEALSDLESQPQPTGQLGADIVLLASGGVGGTRQNVVSAIERLRKVGQFQPAPKDRGVKRWKPRRRQRRRANSSDQLQLPGIGTDTGAAS